MCITGEPSLNVLQRLHSFCRAGEDDDVFWVEYNISVKYPTKISRSVMQQKVGRVLQRLKGKEFLLL